MTLSPTLAILGLWGLAEAALILGKRSKSGAVSKDRHSLSLAMAVGIPTCVLGFLAATRLPACNLPWPKVSLGVGYCAFVLGAALRWYAVFYLGRFFTANVAIAKDHELIDSGPYRFVRHPSYTGSLLGLFGFTLLLLHNWAAVLIILVPSTATLLYRIHVEEQALVEALGEPYRAYMRRTARLVPLIY